MKGRENRENVEKRKKKRGKKISNTLYLILRRKTRTILQLPKKIKIFRDMREPDGPGFREIILY